MPFIPMVPRVILAGFTSLSIKSDKYKLLCHIAKKKKKKTKFILEPVVILAAESTFWFSW